MAALRVRPIPRSLGRGLFVAAILSGTLSVLDSTLVVPLLFSIGQDLGGGTRVSWLVAAYLVASTVFIPVWGRWLDVSGERRPMWTALLVFAAGTVLATFAPNLDVLILARVIQGIGAGGIVPIGQAIVAGRCSTEERARMQIYYNIAYGTAAGLGPLIGGLLVGVSWRWAFAIVLPFIVVVALLLLGRLSTTPRAPDRSAFDVGGAVLLTAGLVTILLGIERQVPWLVPVGILLVAALIRRSRRIADAVIPWRVLHHPAVIAASVITLVIGFVQFSMITYLPMLSLKVAPDLNSGLVVVPLTVLWMTSGAVTGMLALRIGYRLITLIGVVSGVLAAVTLTISTALPALLVASLLTGLATGAILIPLLLLVQHSVSGGDVGSATSLVVVTRNFGGAAGAALTAVLLAGLGVSETFWIVAAITASALIPALVLPGRVRS